MVVLLSCFLAQEKIYQQGYSTISNLSKGNFNLHNIYLTGLMAVNPEVRNNPRVGQIINQQNDIFSEYKRYAGRWLTQCIA